MTNYDLIIIGAGPAGLTAAVYSARFKIKTLVLGSLPGGLAGEAHEVCNFPSYGKISGMELMMKMVKQVQDLGVQIKSEEVENIKQGKTFEIKTKKNSYTAKKLIIATGSERRKLNAPREKELLGKGISYCATCDSGFYKDKIVAVIGGGDAALTASLLLSRFAKKVYIIYRKDKFSRGDPTWVDQAEKTKNIEFIFNSEITNLFGKSSLEEIEINGKEKIKVDGLFIEVGSVPNTKLAEMLKLKLSHGYIEVDKNQKTNVDGVYAAGDITNNPLKQIVTACAEGAIASQTAYKELQGGKK
ncbi:FAD-dependent oxidoreductase [Candidatus Pacearchaeota archaeon]|nr:hypothetical protein [uncultured archaeon]MBS3076453.1 FAD-dependent oxidoreductase [Candidatus Pacearchaeota archaeon]